MKTIYSSLCVFLFMLVFAQAQNLQWTVKKPFDQNKFIENKGQFPLRGTIPSNKIDAGCTTGGLTYYIGREGFSIIRYEVLKSKEEREKEGKGSEHELEEKMNRKIEEKTYEVKFTGYNPSCEIIKSDVTTDYFTYSDLKSAGHKGTLKASAYRKITYKNYYEHIDLVYEFSEERAMMKYSFVLHPGSKLSDIKFETQRGGLNVPGMAGSLMSQSPFGLIKHSAPLAYILSDKKKVNCWLEADKRKVNFSAEEIPSDKTWVIDPWVITPTFSNTNVAFDVDNDAAGNVFAATGTSASPLQLQKYSSSGTLLWTYTATAFQNANCYYGDFAVDKNSGNIYLCEGFNGSGSVVVKINNVGAQLSVFPGNPQFIEMWRIAFSNCTNQAVIAGGGISNPTYQTCYLDSNLSNLTPQQYINTTNCCHDVNMLAMDNYGFSYQVTNRSSMMDGLFDNALVKLPLSNLSTPTYSVASGYAFEEAATNGYYSPTGFSPVNISSPNGYNGIAISNVHIYTWDGYALYKRNSANGAVMLYKKVNNAPGLDSSITYWGGITTDECDHIFVGSLTTINQYDSLFNLVNTYSCPDTITDLKLGSSGLIYACGMGFVSAIQINNLPACSSSQMSITPTVTNATCNGPGSASVSVNGGSPPITVTWNTSPPQTGNVLLNPVPGTYIVTVEEGSCLHQVITDTLVIGAGPGAFGSVPLVTFGCPGSTNSGTISITQTGGVAPFNYAWSNGLPNSPNQTGLAPNTYTVLITDAAGCTNNLSLTVSTPAQPTYTVTATGACTDSVALTLNITGNAAPYTVSWTNPSASGNTVYIDAPGIYYGSFTDNANCQFTFSDTVSALPIFSADITNHYSCTAGYVVLDVDVNTGSAPYVFTWAGNPSNTSDSLIVFAPGIYTVTVIDANNCTITFIDTVSNISAVSVTSFPNMPCSGGSNGSINLNVTGSGPFTYNWFGFPGNNTGYLGNLAAGQYTVSVSNGSCGDTLVETLAENPMQDSSTLFASYCQGAIEATIFFEAVNGITGPYQWYENTTAIPGATGTSYTGNLSSINNYYITWYYNGCKYKTSYKNIGVTPVPSGNEATNIFSPNGDTKNEVFYPVKDLLSQPWIFDLKSYNLQIYDRWGLKVFETYDVNKGWDGKNLHGDVCDEAVYFYMMTLKTFCAEEEPLNFKGYVHLMR